MKNPLTFAELAVLSVSIFKKNPMAQEVFASEDGNIFLDENRAKLHTDGKEITYYGIRKSDALGTDNSGDNFSDEDVFQVKQKELEALELVSANYQKMKALVSYFNIETPDLKAETLINALTEYKSKISQ